MPAYKTNMEAQAKYAPAQNFEPFLKGVPKEKLFIPKEGQYRLRVMPAWSPAGYFAKVVATHWEVGMSKLTVICPNYFVEGSCPFDKAYNEMKADYKAYEIDINAGVRPSKRFYSNVVNLSAPEAGVCVWSYGITVYKMLIGLQQSGEYGDITDAINGTDLILTRSGQGKASKDIIYPVRGSSPIANPAWLDQLFNLDDIFKAPDPNDILAAFNTHPWKIYRPTGSAAVIQPVAAASSPVQPVAVTPVQPIAATPVQPVNTGTAPVVFEPVPTSAAPAASQPISTGTVAQPIPAGINEQRTKDLDELRAKLRAKMGGQ